MNDVPNCTHLTMVDRFGQSRLMPLDGKWQPISLADPVSTPTTPGVTKMATSSRVAPTAVNANDLDGLSDVKLSSDAASILHLVRSTMAKMHDGTGETAADYMTDAIDLLWGQEGTDLVNAAGDKQNAQQSREAIEGEHERKGEAKVSEPGVATMSLDRLYETGRCTKAERVRMSLSNGHDRQLFIDSRKALPEGTFANVENRAHAEETAAWALGGPRPQRMSLHGKQADREKRLKDWALGRGPHPDA